ncbi:MAG: dihydrolipoamide acetyltransferase family protein [Nitrospirota bacterium]|jgi:2-oxoglutarate dehydrogenase E2 component (dihydrolipoamide succinyltransferase)/2-oxoisovalerate dehydrogenase E2 component (dihydrolipoyl transacylase)
MEVNIIMPQMGESVAEGTILQWLANEGERIDKDKPVVEISTDKVDTEVPSPVTGVLSKILHKENETIPVGTVIGIIQVQAAETEEITTPKEIITTKFEVQAPKAGLSEREKISPLVKTLARQYGIDLKKVKGTGEGGRITKKDIMDYAGVKPVEEEAQEREEVIPLSPKRKIIAERMSLSKKTIPHVTTNFEIDMTGIVKYREKRKESFLKEKGFNLTYLPFITKAVITALKEFPILNSTWTEDGIRIKRYVNLGIATSIEDGLIVPVIRDADKKDFLILAGDAQDLAKRARDKKLRPDEVQEGTFTITNYGLGGSLFGNPIIVPNQAAILGIGAIQKRPVVIDDAIAIRSMVYLSLSFDHRILDGAQADQFMRRVKEILETWDYWP